MLPRLFCNQKVKIKKEIPDSISSISLNTANPFKLYMSCKLLTPLSRSVPPETLPLIAKDLCGLFCWTQALSYWKTPAWLSQSGEQRPHWTIHYTEEMSWEIWMLDLRNAFYPGKETQTEHSIRLNKSETI